MILTLVDSKSYVFGFDLGSGSSLHNCSAVHLEQGPPGERFGGRHRWLAAAMVKQESLSRGKK
jgi:hypothetical protein